MKNREKSVQPAGICNLCCWTELWLWGRRLINWGRNGRVKLPQAHIWSMLLCCLRKFNFKVSAVLHYLKDWCPGILQRIIECGPLSSKAQIFPGLNTLKINVCVDSDSIIMLKQCPGIKFLSFCSTTGGIIWHDSLHACTVLWPAFITWLLFLILWLKVVAVTHVRFLWFCTLKDAKAATISQYIGCI